MNSKTYIWVEEFRWKCEIIVGKIIENSPVYIFIIIMTRIEIPKSWNSTIITTRVASYMVLGNSYKNTFWIPQNTKIVHDEK